MRGNLPLLKDILTSFVNEYRLEFNIDRVVSLLYQRCANVLELGHISCSIC